MKVRLRDKSGIRLYRYIVEDVDRHGNVRIYFRRTGQPKIRLRERPGTEAFDALDDDTRQKNEWDDL